MDARQTDTQEDIAENLTKLTGISIQAIDLKPDNRDILDNQLADYKQMLGRALEKSKTEPTYTSLYRKDQLIYRIAILEELLKGRARVQDVVTNVFEQEHELRGKEFKDAWLWIAQLNS